MIPILFITEKEKELILELSREQWVNEVYLYKEVYILKILSYFTQIWLDECLVLKWWTWLSLFHGSWRYSEDIDCDLSKRDKALYTVQTKLRQLNKLNRNNLWFFFPEITDSKSKWSFRFPYENTQWYESVTFDFRFVDLVDSTKKEVKNKTLLFDSPSFRFPCHLDDNLLCSKLIAVWGREKWRDLYDLNFLITNWYKLSLDFFKTLFESQTTNSKENNIFHPVLTIDEVMKQLLERVNSLEKNSSNLLSDINDFLPRRQKLQDIDSFFIELYTNIEDSFREVEKNEFSNDFETNLDFTDLLEFEDSPRRVEIIKYLKNWNSREFTSQTKLLPNWDFIQLVKNINATYIIVEYKTGLVIKGFKRKEELIDFLYKSYSKYFSK